MRIRGDSALADHFFPRYEIIINHWDSLYKGVQRNTKTSDLAPRNFHTAPETEILVRIISFDKGRYVCQWIAGKYTDTQDYKILK